jgi:hypothetical protein
VWFGEELLGVLDSVQVQTAAVSTLKPPLPVGLPVCGLSLGTVILAVSSTIRCLSSRAAVRVLP